MSGFGRLGRLKRLERDIKRAGEFILPTWEEHVLVNRGNLTTQRLQEVAAWLGGDEGKAWFDAMFPPIEPVDEETPIAGTPVQSIDYRRAIAPLAPEGVEPVTTPEPQQPVPVHRAVLPMPEDEDVLLPVVKPNLPVPEPEQVTPHKPSPFNAFHPRRERQPIPNFTPIELPKRGGRQRVDGGWLYADGSFDPE